jgi:putative chitinase
MTSIEVAIGSLGAAARQYAYALEMAMIEGGIISPLEKAHFIAQVAHESGNFVHTEENLNYSAQGLRKTFAKYFKTDQEALVYGRKPMAIANRVYANRMGNGNEASGDGWKYRGRGPIQLTGKENYTKASKAIFGDIRLVINPDLVKNIDVGAKVAVWFWNMKECCGPSRLDDCVAVTRRINGGTNGLEDRKRLLALMKQYFT